MGQKITLLCVGKLRTSWIAEGCAEYQQRLRGSMSLMIYALPFSKFREERQQRDDESGRLLETARKFGGEMWVLDETGKGMTSRMFTSAVGAARDRGTSITVVLGGAYGLTDPVRASATRVLKLSDMTFPHELCRLVFLEQLYRASEILKGSGYHH